MKIARWTGLVALLAVFLSPGGPAGGAELAAGSASVVSMSAEDGPYNPKPNTMLYPNCIDPSVFVDGNQRYMFCTGGNSNAPAEGVYKEKVAFHAAPGATTWSPRTYKIAFPPSACGNFWAPVVAKRADGRYVMIYGANHNKWTSSGRVCLDRGPTEERCLFVAVADSPLEGEPIEGQTVEAGYRAPSAVANGLLTGGCENNTYAASWFRAGGSPYIVAKREGLGIAIHKMEANMIRPCKPDSASATNCAPGDEDWVDMQIIKNREWEKPGAPKPPIEGPAFLRLPTNEWVLFYTGGGWTSDAYAEGYALCGKAAVPAPPCTKPLGNVIISKFNKDPEGPPNDDGDFFSLGAGMGYVYDGDYYLAVAGFYGFNNCGGYACNFAWHTNAAGEAEVYPSGCANQAACDEIAGTLVRRPRYTRVFKLRVDDPTSIKIVAPQ
jgi:hypothetical protein